MTSKSTLFANVGSGAVMMLFGTYVVFEAQKFDGVGASMPLFVGFGLIAFSALLIVVSVVKASLVGAIAPPTGSMKPRLALTVLMALWVLALPYAGFILSSIVAFGLITAIVPRHESWSVKGLLSHFVGGVAVILAFWYVLTAHLNVPLPAGQLF
ncbi:MAG: tripartite tricarboxylate transporter TctB family protein [Pseudomonadota bacterium]